MYIVNYIIGLLLYIEVALCSSHSAIRLTELAKESQDYIIDVYNSDLSILEGPEIISQFYYLHLRMPIITVSNVKDSKCCYQSSEFMVFRSY